jgi:hypothetical protein
LKVLPLTLLATLILIAILTATAPLEKTLGDNARLVYLHGSWVWTAMVVFLAAAAAGLGGLVSRRQWLHEWSLALGRTALVLWITFLPQSLYLMQANWNGLFLDEPRFRTPLNLAVVGLLLQIGISFFPVRFASLANIVFAGSLFWVMNGLQTVLHPEGPIQNSSSTSIQLVFGLLLILMIALALQVAWVWQRIGVWRGQILPNQPEKRSA